MVRARAVNASEQKSMSFSEAQMLRESCRITHSHLFAPALRLLWRATASQTLARRWPSAGRLDLAFDAACSSPHTAASRPSLPRACLSSCSAEGKISQPQATRASTRSSAAFGLESRGGDLMTPVVGSVKASRGIESL